MKIAFILPSLINNGPIVVVNNVVKYLKSYVEQIDVYYFDATPAMDFDCPVYKIRMNQAIDFDKYDIIHSHCLRPDKYVIKWRKKIKNAKIITTLHQDTFRSFQYQYNIALAYLFTRYWCHLQSKFDGVISISNQLKDGYQSYIHSKLTTIYNGCIINEDSNLDASIISKQMEVKEKYKLLGTYAFVTRRKGLEQILKALIELPDYAFMIIGDGPDIARLLLLSKQTGISDRVYFIPYQKKPYNYLANIDVYVMPSYSEGFGLSMVEAALAKKSIVCSELPSFHEIFNNDEACFFELDNIDSLKRSIILAYENKLKLGERAYNKASDMFTAQRMAENHLKYYQNLFV